MPTRRTDPEPTEAAVPEDVDGRTIVYPVAGRYLAGVATVPTRTNAETAARQVATGAFTSDEPEREPDQPVVEPVPFAGAALAGLDYYDPPAPPAAETSGEVPGQSPEA
jgi:hypothetical protein